MFLLLLAAGVCDLQSWFRSQYTAREWTPGNGLHLRSFDLSTFKLLHSCKHFYISSSTTCFCSLYWGSSFCLNTSTHPNLPFKTNVSEVHFQMSLSQISHCCSCVAPAFCHLPALSWPCLFGCYIFSLYTTSLLSWNRFSDKIVLLAWPLAASLCCSVKLALSVNAGEIIVPLSCRLITLYSAVSYSQHTTLHTTV